MYFLLAEGRLGEGRECRRATSWFLYYPLFRKRQLFGGTLLIAVHVVSPTASPQAGKRKQPGRAISAAIES